MLTLPRIDEEIFDQIYEMGFYEGLNFKKKPRKSTLDLLKDTGWGKFKIQIEDKFLDDLAETIRRA